MVNVIKKVLASGKIKSIDNSGKSTLLEFIKGAKKDKQKEVFIVIP